MFIVPKGQRLLVQVALLILLGASAFVAFSHWGDLRNPSWLASQTHQDEPRYGPLLGAYEDPQRLYYPPTSRSQPLRVANYALPPAVRPRTPLFIGFTNNNAMLNQAVLSYIAAGWPPEDIVVVDNTGTMDSNPTGRLAKDNYFFLDYSKLRELGVSILQTPTLFSFAQLQNFYIRTCLAHGLKNFFWSHMDVVAVGDEAAAPFRSFYQRIVDVVETYQNRDDWAIKWFSCTLGLKACDFLVWNNVEAWRKIGQWDPFIPYYSSDCDAFSRMALNGFPRKEASTDIYAGHIFDTRRLLDNPEQMLFPTTPDEEPNSPRFQKLFQTLEEFETEKLSDDGQRNDWQENHGSRKLSPGDWTYDPKAFRTGWWGLSDAGKAYYDRKWGEGAACELDDYGGSLEDMWKHIHERSEGLGRRGENRTAAL